MIVLITGCSKHSKELIDCIKNNEDGVEVQIVGTDCNEKNLLKTGVDYGYVVPRIDSVEYLPKMMEICLKHNVDVLMPYITAELELMAQYRGTFEDLGTHVSVTDLHSLRIANNKVKMAQMFPELMPKQILISPVNDVDRFAKTINYPERKMCIKLTDRCGGTGFAIVDDEKAKDISLFNKIGVNRYISYEDVKKLTKESSYDILLQEYIDGIDYSVCVLADKGEVLHMCGYVGYSMVYGAVVNGEIYKDHAAYDIAQYVTKRIGLDGNACFDFMLDGSGHATLLEVNPRLNASLPFVAKAGLNLAWLRCRQLMGYDVSSQSTQTIPKYGLKVNKFYESEYFE